MGIPDAVRVVCRSYPPLVYAVVERQVFSKKAKPPWTF
jgi:hypothetical protein